MLCFFFGHNYEITWDEEFMLGAGPVKIKKEECERCQKKRKFKPEEYKIIKNND